MLFGASAQSTWYASPTGTSSGDGSYANPWDLQTAFDQPVGFVAGDTLKLMGGVYHGEYVSNLTGTAGNKIIVMPYDKYSVPILDKWAWVMYYTQIETPMGLTFNGAYTDIIDIGIISSKPYHWSLLSGSVPLYGIGGGAVTTNGVECDLINCYIFYSNAVATFKSAYADGADFYGNIIGYNGRVAPDRGHGQGAYLQNNPTDPMAYASGNIYFKNCSYGQKVYSRTDKVHNYTIEDNISFMNGTPAWSYDGNRAIELFASDDSNESEGSNVIFRGNSVWQSDSSRAAGISAGAYQTNHNFQVVKNTVAGGLYGVKIGGLDYDSRIDSNFVYAPVFSNLGYGASAAGDTGFVSFDYNIYYQNPASTSYFEYNSSSSFTSWTSAHTFDANSTYSNTIPTTNIINIYPNEYEDGRGHVAIFNFTGATNIDVDLSDICSIGDSVVVYDIERMFGDNALIKTVYSGADISFPLDLTLQDSIPEYSDIVHHSSSDFNAYLVMPYTLNLPVVNKGVSSVLSDIIIDSLVENNPDYTVYFHDEHPYTGETYNLVVMTSAHYRDLSGITSPHNFNMIELYPFSGDDDYILSIYNDSIYAETEFSYTTTKEFSNIWAFVRNSDFLVTMTYFQKTSGYDDYGKIFDDTDTQIGDSVYHITVAGINFIYHKEWYLNSLTPDFGNYYITVRDGTTPNQYDTIPLRITADPGVSKSTIFDWTLHDNDRTLVEWWKPTNYSDSLIVVNDVGDVMFYHTGGGSGHGNMSMYVDMKGWDDGTYKVYVRPSSLTYSSYIDSAIYVKAPLDPDLPVADAGANQTVNDSDNSGSESITLDGSGSSDTGTITNYTWTEGGSTIATGATPTHVFSVGSHTVTLTVTDNDSNTDDDNVLITVTPYVIPPQPDPNDSIIIISDVMLTDSILNNRQPGDTLYLKTNFTGTHTFSLSGDASHITVIKSHPDHTANFSAYQIITGDYLRFENVTFNNDVFVQGDNIELNNVTAAYEGMTLQGENITVDSCTFSACDTALFYFQTIAPVIKHNTFTATNENIYEFLFPSTDWRGYNYSIDNNTFNIKTLNQAQNLTEEVGEVFARPFQISILIVPLT